MVARAGTSHLAGMLLLAFWLGAALLFSLVVAPAAFAVLPERALAGALVGRVLPALLYAGMLLGAVQLGLHWSSGLRFRAMRLVCAALVFAGCAVAQLVIAPRIAELRAGITQPLESMAEGDPARAAFGRLHGMSLGWFGLSLLAGTLLLTTTIVGARATPDTNLK